MNPLVRELLPQIVAVALAIGGAAGAIVSWWLRPKWQARFDVEAGKLLDQFRHTLAMDSARADFDHQRRLVEFNLVAKERHAAIEKLHALLLDASSKIRRLHQGDPYVPTWDAMEAHQLPGLLEERRIDAPAVGKIVALWETDRPAAIAAANQALRYRSLQDARNAKIRANNWLLEKSIYLSDSLIEAANGFLEALRVLLWGAEPNAEDLLRGFRPATPHDVGEHWIRMSALMRREMQRNDLDQPVAVAAGTPSGTGIVRSAVLPAQREH